VRQIRTLGRRDPLKLWLLTVVAFLLLIIGTGAVPSAAPVQWEYKTVWFQVNAGDDMNVLQTRFADALNQEASRGWEYVGRCAHTDSLYSCADFIVFRRPRI